MAPLKVPILTTVLCLFSCSAAAILKLLKICLYHGEITWAPPGNHVGPTRKSRAPHPEITWAPRGNHVGPTRKSRGPHPEITCAPRGNHVGPQGKSRGLLVRVYYLMKMLQEEYVKDVDLKFNKGKESMDASYGRLCRRFIERIR